MTKTTDRLSVALSLEQVDYLLQWGIENNLMDKAGNADRSAIIRAALHIAFNDFPADPPPHGGYRGGRAPVNGTVVLLADYGKHRAGTCGVVVKRTVRGAEVAFGSEVIPVRYRDLKVEDV